MSVTEPIFIKLTLAIAYNNYKIEFHKNPTNSGVTDTRSQTERQTDVASTKNIPFCTVKNAYMQCDQSIKKPQWNEIFVL
jgi:hypothetical protein